MNLLWVKPVVFKDDLLAWSKELNMIEPYLEEAPFELLCGDRVMVSVAFNFVHIDLICI